MSLDNKVIDIFDTQYFKINKFFLSFSGLWPYQKPLMKLLTRSFIIFGMTTMLLPQIAYMIRQANDLDKTFELLPILAGTILCITRFIAILRNFEMFKALLRHTQDDWNNLLTNEETQILMHYAEKSRKLSVAYSICVIGFVSCFGLLALTAPVLDIISPLNETRPRKLPQLMDYIILDQEKHYYTLLLIVYLDHICCVMNVIASDTLYVFLVEHICGMYGILCHRLRNLTTYNKLRWINSDYMHEEIDRRIRHCIQLHERILLFTQMMERVVSLFLFFDIVFGFLLHTTLCIMITIRTGSSDFIRYLSLIMMQSCRLFFNNWAGQEIVDHSVQISIAAYDGMWYKASIKVQKLLLFLIARGQKASQLTIAKLYVINLQNFTKVIRTSVSYCTVMISLRESSSGA